MAYQEKERDKRISDKIGPAFVDMTATYVKSGDVSFCRTNGQLAASSRRDGRIVDVDVDQELLIEVDTEPSFSSSPWILAESFFRSPKCLMQNSREQRFF